MNDLMKELYKRYGDFSYDYGQPLSLETALKIYKSDIHSLEDIEPKIKEFESELLNEKINHEYNELVSELETLQPSSFSFQLMYIWLLLDSMENDYFVLIELERLDLYRIVHSIVYYLLFLQTYSFTNLSISKSAIKSIFGRKDFLVGITELKKVCCSITEDNYKKFCELFALDIDKHDIEILKDVHLFMDGENIFIFWINDFLDYILYDVERKYRKWSISERYSAGKGTGFEQIVYGFTSQFYNKSVQNVFYHEPKKKSEIDLIIRDGCCLIITECKSGTIDLRKASSDKEITHKLNNKLKKAYETLDNVASYIEKNEVFMFEEKNKKVAIEGYTRDFDFIYVHLSMYPIDALSSSIHVLNDKYFRDTEKPKLTISFEHFIAICVDCQENNRSLGEYLSIRRDLLETHPNIKFDNNELDLYYQLTNKSMLNESLTNGVLDEFSPDVRVVSTYSDQEGNEIGRPAGRLLFQLENRIFGMMLEVSKRSLGFNKKFTNYMNQYLTEKRE